MTVQTKFRPLRDHLLVRPLDRLSHFGASRIIVVSDEQHTSGVVLAAGPGRRLKSADDEVETGEVVPMSVKVGDRVRYGNGSYLKFTHIEIDGERLLVMREKDVCWIEPKERKRGKRTRPAGINQDQGRSDAVQQPPRQDAEDGQRRPDAVEGAA